MDGSASRRTLRATDVPGAGRMLAHASARAAHVRAGLDEQTGQLYHLLVDFLNLNCGIPAPPLVSRNAGKDRIECGY